MDTVTRINYEESMRTIATQLLSNPRKEEVPEKYELASISDAVDALRDWQEECPKLNLHRHIAVLNYHVREPQAILFKDRYTMAALKAGAQALEHALGKRAIYEDPTK